jgi:hypothetical protein
MVEPPDGVLTGVLVGGDLNGLEVEIDPGQSVITLGPPLITFGADDEATRDYLTAQWEYRYVGINHDGAEPRAQFRFHRRIDTASGTE